MEGSPPQGSEPLKVVTAAVGLLAGIVAAVYVLGGLVITLRLFFDGFEPGSVATIIGQLPRELVVTTAMLDVGLPAAAVGVGMTIVAAILAAIRLTPADENNGRSGILTMIVLSVLLVVPAIVAAAVADEVSPKLFWALVPIAITAAIACAAWREVKRVANRETWSVTLRLAAIGALGGVVALVPAVAFAAALDFEHVQVCISSSSAPEKGLLIGEGGGHVLLESRFVHEESVISLPSDNVTKSEYGDLSSVFVCPASAGEAAGAEEAEATLGDHGSAAERALAVRLRPRLRFSRYERWRPLAVDAFLRERYPGGGAQIACRALPRTSCAPLRGPADLRRRPGMPSYIDIEGHDRDGMDFVSPDSACRGRPPAVDCNGGPRAAIYYRRTSHEGRWYWDYWWFFRYNDYTGPYNRCERICGDHEGDWEGVTVVTSAALEPQILDVIYAAHRVRVLADGASAPLAGGHPLVFVAEGTHASYPFACARACGQYSGFLGFHLPEDPHDGAVAWGGNHDAECAAFHCVRPLPEVGHPSAAALPLAGSWAGWPGSWGTTCYGGCHGFLSERESSPRSPGTQTRFKCPWAATRWALPGPDGKGLSRSEEAGDAERLLAGCEAQRGGL